ncbi:prephenate dehydratase [Henriciella litoralis]|uniref:prephenate dehydratase n=1 Tax=Henriciella litoralis TaxID=568102 RepID=UPI000A03A964|nr:prephenate dehydratase [Henriciella litoralis]
MSETRTGRIAYQGEPGANSHIACNDTYPGMEPVACKTFEDVITMVERGDADLAMIPVENTIAGRVGDIHHLLPGTSLHMIAEHFMPIRFQLMALPGVTIDEIETAHSHIMALGQCRRYLRDRSISAVIAADTAGAARIVRDLGDRTVAAIAPELAAEVYGLDILARNIEDAEHNTTRFVIMAPQPVEHDRTDGPTVTAFLFQVRNIPAALYKAMGGFATNGVNMTKLESYQVDGSFTATQFYAEIEGHPDERNVQLALEELGFFSTSLKIIGVFPAHPERFRFAR